MSISGGTVVLSNEISVRTENVTDAEIGRLRRALWDAWYVWYQVYNDDKASVKRTADALRDYTSVKRELVTYAQSRKEEGARDG